MTNLTEWLKQFPREEAESRISELEGELAAWRQAMSIHESLTGQAATNGPTSAPGVVPTKPLAIATILRDAKGSLAPGEILAEMVRRGWLPGEAKYKKRFYATLSRMTAESRVKRLSNGRYVLPESSQEALPSGA